MSTIHSHIRPNTHLFLRLPSDSLKLLEITPNTIIDVGKLGSFPANLLLGRPYFYTYELLNKRDGEAHSRLRIVPSSGLNAEIATEDATPSESGGEPVTPGTDGLRETYDILEDDGTVIVKNNRLTIDDANRQALSQQEIEELKKSAGGREIVEKILANHTGLDEKTAFSKAKYTLRKTKKYLKRITVLPMDIGNLMEYILERDAARIMELREEMLALMLAWSHVHYSADDDMMSESGSSKAAGSRWLVVDETGGLLVAAMAEKMGILYPHTGEQQVTQKQIGNDSESSQPQNTSDDTTTQARAHQEEGKKNDALPLQPDSATYQAQHADFPIPASTNTITLLHPAVQPNVSLLKYFGYDTNLPDPLHALHTHLKPLSWLQLLSPQDDATYQEPGPATEHILKGWKSGKRGTYWKKRRRWERCKSIVDEARAGGFDGLIIASSMDPVTMLPHLIPLIRGGGHVVLYSPTSEPLVNVMDLYSKERRAAYVRHLAKDEIPDAVDFPVDPRLLLAPTLQTSRVREWQVLPGRTHPLMTGRGGAEGYLFTARRVVPLEGGVEARGNFSGKKRKADI